MKASVRWTVVAAVIAWCLLAAPARADFQGSDVFSNVAPPSQLDSAGMAGRYPPGHYALDTHVDAGITNPGGAVALIPHFLANQLWELTKLLVLAVISLFSWAFSLDLIAGGPRGGGALEPISAAVERLYARSFGQSWLVVGILLAGLWGIWKALVQRRYAETAGQLALSVLFVVTALFFVHRPEQTIGRASQLTNELSLAFLGAATQASVDAPERAKQGIADHLFATLIHEPWVVLNFGGLRHCVDGDHRPVAPDDARRTRCLDHLSQQNGRGGYAERFLRYPPGSQARNAEYEAIRDGQIPTKSILAGALDAAGAVARGDVIDAFAQASRALGASTDEQFRGYRVDADDRPAVDIAAGRRLPALDDGCADLRRRLGAIAVLGGLSLAVVLAQVLALFYLAFAPVALVAGVFPGRGHDLFRAWLSRLVGALLRKAIYSLVLAVVLAVSAALTAATSSLGWLVAFGLQTSFYWLIFLRRRELVARLTMATSGDTSHDRPGRLPRRARHLPRRALRAIRHPHRSAHPEQPPRFSSRAGSGDSYRSRSGGSPAARTSRQQTSADSQQSTGQRTRSRAPREAPRRRSTGP